MVLSETVALLCSAVEPCCCSLRLCVAAQVFSTDRHPNSLGPCPDDPLDAGEEWTPFDFTMSRFLHGTRERGREALTVSDEL